MRYIPSDMPHGPALGYQAPRKRRRRVLGLVLLFVPLFLFGCAGPRFEQCKLQAGPKPYADSEKIFGIAGALVTAMDPDRRAWNHRVRMCMADSP